MLVIDAHMIIVISSFTPKIAVIIERCPAMLYSQRQNRDNPLMQEVYLARCE